MKKVYSYASPGSVAGRSVAGATALATDYGAVGARGSRQLQERRRTNTAPSSRFMSWNGPDAKERMARIVQDLDRLSANGVFIVNMSPGRGEPEYLSPEHMAQVKFVVQEAKKRGMKLWLQDESDYPSGFAGGKVSQEYPQLTMQGLDADIRISVMPGQTLTMPTPPDTLGALAVFPSTGAVMRVPIDSSGIKWMAPAAPPAQPATRNRGSWCWSGISFAVLLPAISTEPTALVARTASTH